MARTSRHEGAEETNSNSKTYSKHPLQDALFPQAPGMARTSRHEGAEETNSNSKTYSKHPLQDALFPQAPVIPALFFARKLLKR